MIAALAMTSGTQRAEADLGKALGVLGGAAILGCATGALNCKGNRSKSRSTAPRSSGISQAQRQQNRDVQSSLNAFGFPVGAVDGSLGKRSRAAIRDYQGYMGYARTGQLTEAERNMLVGGWQQLNAGAGNAYPRTMAAVGPRGLLNIQRDPNFPSQFGDPVQRNYGNGYANNQGSTGTWQNGQQFNNAGVQPQPQPQPIQPLPRANPTPQPQLGALPKLAPLKPIGQVIVSAASRCELVDQTTRIQGGVIQASNMTDSNQALSEKFCEARGFAITQGGSVASQFQVSETELEALCAQIKTGFEPVLASLADTPQPQAIATAKTTAAGLGLTDPATTAAYGQICMGIGYRLDNAEMALSGVMAMLAADQAPYGEMVGHHLREGFGVTASSSAAVPYYQSSMAALEQGATPALVPSTTSERIQVIRAALQLDAQRAGNTGQLPNLIKTSATLPALQPVQQ
ncbi:peptidoglycan-binding domain-containing protein [Tateyamaria sp.]|uniref:peptidoglycan-binding domain-containing protein n=1 Tax=Tateyamaria sp. TaxID=1929288 RepID=UPI003B21E767